MGPAIVVTAEDDDGAGLGDGRGGGKAMVVGIAVETFIIVALQNKKAGQTVPRTGSSTSVL